MQIIPSIDVDNTKDFTDQIQRLKPYYQHFHIDYADGLFVPFTSVTLSEAISALKQLTGLLLDFHLMTGDISNSLELLRSVSNELGIQTVFVHHTASPDPSLFGKGLFSFNLGLVLNPEDDVDTIVQTYTLPDVQNILIMTVSPGPQGSPFLSNSLNKLEQLRMAGYRNKISLDGAVNEESLKIILKRNDLPDAICPGSYFSRAQNLEERVQYLSKLFDHENNSNQDPQDNHK